MARRSSVRVHALIIDPQVDFMDLPNSALPVGGADADTKRLSAMIARLGGRIDDIHVTLDSHHLMHIANPIMWTDSTGKAPSPFTIISAADVNNGKWRARNPSWQKWQAEYVEDLEKKGRYPLCIWPPHCLIGSNGYQVHPVLFDSLRRWEEGEFGMVDYVTKGSNYKTEHYSAVQAEVPDPSDPGTSLNMGLIQTLQDADIIIIAGQALSHCVANTVRDIAANFSTANIEKMHLLRDCSSPVQGFEQAGKDFITEMAGKGMKVVDSATFMA